VLWKELLLRGRICWTAFIRAEEDPDRCEVPCIFRLEPQLLPKYGVLLEYECSYQFDMKNFEDLEASAPLVAPIVLSSGSWNTAASNSSLVKT
jgi:hypothetical protein